MTSDSRVEAVARAIDPEAFRWMGTSLHNARALQAAYEKAEIAIEASDAWIAAQIAAQDPIAFRRTKSPRIEGLAPAARRILDR